MTEHMVTMDNENVWNDHDADVDVAEDFKDASSGTPVVASSSAAGGTLDAVIPEEDLAAPVSSAAVAQKAACVAEQVP